MSVSVHNIKISVKVPYRGLEALQQCFSGKKKIFRNFFVVDDSGFNFCFFKYRQTKFSMECIQRKHHVNITKIRNFLEITEAIDILVKRINISLADISYTIDNITARTILPFGIDLEKFQIENKDLNLHQNLEKFPGLFIKLGFITLALFRSGKINFVGCKSLSIIEETNNWIRERCLASMIMN